MPAVTLRFEERLYQVTPDTSLICDIEDELGGIPALADRFASSGWKITELITLVQMMLESAGRTMDFRALGNKMLEEGLDDYLKTACKFLKKVSPDTLQA